MSINLFDVLKEMNDMTRSCYEDTYEDYPDGSRGIKMPTFNNDNLDDEADKAAYEQWKVSEKSYERWKAKNVNKEDDKC